jgi:putative nucleotidyltransferase with HDIG domain
MTSNTPNMPNVTNTEIEKILNRIDELPTLPSVVEQINTLLQNPKTSAEEVGQAILTDQAIASKVIKLVNSAFYGFPGRINTITHAIVILGFNTVRNIVLTASIISAFKTKIKHQEFDLTSFWKHSVATGAYALTIARLFGHKNTEEIFLAGLIHDIGKLIEFIYLPDEFEQMLTLAQSKKMPLRDAEKEVLRVTHDVLGAMLGNTWKLPDYLKDVMTWHHNPSQAKNQQLTEIVHIADIIAQGMSFGNSGNFHCPPFSNEAYIHLDLNPDKIGQILRNGEIELDRASIFLKLL